MTVRELRSILFHVDNQEITVKELRKILFDIEEQDKEIDDLELSRLTK